jgi:4-diphosphocytidyl-2-C-methyl-D-erythritol kinase
MQVRSTDSGWEVWAPAKLNLFLEVLFRRDDGFHELETLMCPIDLYDTLRFRPDASGCVSLTCRWAEGGGKHGASHLETLPEGTANTVVRACELLRRRAGSSLGAQLTLVKRIPMAAGLAGGSSDAAAALLAANQGWALNLSPLELANLAAEIGSDVPFFLGRGPAICRGRGERIEPLDGLGSLHFVVVKPPVGLSTADVYRACRPAITPQQAAGLAQALRDGRMGRAGRLLVNRLQPAAESLTEQIGVMKAEFARLDVLGHQMSGSGTSYFALCRSARHARRVARFLEVRGVGHVYAVRSCI